MAKKDDVYRIVVEVKLDSDVAKRTQQLKELEKLGDRVARKKNQKGVYHEEVSGTGIITRKYLAKDEAARDKAIEISKMHGGSAKSSQQISAQNKTETLTKRMKELNDTFSKGKHLLSKPRLDEFNKTFRSGVITNQKDLPKATIFVKSKAFFFSGLKLPFELKRFVVLITYC